MAEECLHGQQYHHHHHHHVGIAEGITPEYTHKLKWVMGLAIFYFMAQVAGSAFSGSLALLADAGHKLADIGSIALALFAAWFSRLAVSPQKTFGYYRLEILAAFINGLVLMMMALFILYEAYDRLIHQAGPEIESGIMLGIAGLGLIINMVAARILYPAKEANLNVKGAFFHVMADIMGSTGTMITALLIMLFHIDWLDTMISAVIACMVFYNATRILKEAVNILLEAAPRRLEVGDIRHFLLNRPGVTDVHDLHVWTITTGKEALLAHVQVNAEAFVPETVQDLEHQLRERYELCHITLQLEPPGFEEDEIPF